MSDARVEKAVRHYQRDIEQGQDDQRVLYCIKKLYRLPVTVQHLQDTGVGRTVNALRKGDGDVASAARALVNKWKQMVAEEEDAQEHQQNENKNQEDEDDDDNDDDDEDDGDDDREQNEETDKRASFPKPVRAYEEPRRNDTEKYSNDKDNREKHRLEKHKREYEDEEAYHKHKEHKKRKHEELQDQYEYSKNHQSDSYEEKNHNNKPNSTKNIERNHVPQSPETLPNSEPEFHIDAPTLSDDSEEEKQIPNHKPVISNEVDNYSQSSSKESSKSHSKHRSSSSSKSSSSKHDEKKSKHKSEGKSEHKHKDKSKDNTDSKKQKHSHERELSHDHKEKERDRENKKKSKHHDDKHSDKKKEKHSEDRQKNDKDRNRSDKQKEHKNKDNSQRSSSSSKSKPSTSENKSSKRIQSSEDGIGCESGASFAEALGMMYPGKSTSSNKKKSSQSSSNHSSSSKSRSNGDTPNKEERTSKKEQNPVALSLQSKLATQPSLLVPDMKLTPLPPLTVSVSALPEISPNYVPRPAPRLIDSVVPNISEEEALSVVMNTKNQRTKVYSGNRVIHGSIPSLYELCSYVLQENIDALEYTGGVPYDLLKPVIEKATPNQLFTLEHYNPYLIEDTDELWKLHCLKAFRMQKRQEMESWRDMYMRCTDEQEAKLKSLTANIKLAQDKCLPVRQTKMAYVDSVVKPPRNIARKQAIYGTAKKPAVSPAARVASLAGNNVVKGTEVKGAVGTSSGHASRSTGFIKPKKAPLMQKALQLIKGRYKR